MDTDPYRLVRLDGSPEGIASQLRDLDAEGWRLVAVLPYRPDGAGHPVVWEPWAILERKP